MYVGGKGCPSSCPVTTSESTSDESTPSLAIAATRQLSPGCIVSFNCSTAPPCQLVRICRFSLLLETKVARVCSITVSQSALSSPQPSSSMSSSARDGSSTSNT